VDERGRLQRVLASLAEQEPLRLVAKLGEHRVEQLVVARRRVRIHEP
jgi:hypothetical protein